MKKLFWLFKLFKSNKVPLFNVESVTYIFSDVELDLLSESVSATVSGIGTGATLEMTEEPDMAAVLETTDMLGSMGTSDTADRHDMANASDAAEVPHNIDAMLVISAEVMPSN